MWTGCERGWPVVLTFIFFSPFQLYRGVHHGQKRWARRLPAVLLLANSCQPHPDRPWHVHDGLHAQRSGKRHQEPQLHRATDTCSISLSDSSTRPLTSPPRSLLGYRRGTCRHGQLWATRITCGATGKGILSTALHCLKLSSIISEAASSPGALSRFPRSSSLSFSAPYRRPTS